MDLSHKLSGLTQLKQLELEQELAEQKLDFLPVDAKLAASLAALGLAASIAVEELEVRVPALSL